MTFIKNVRTPTLILVGERDIETPVAQSYEFWHALKTLGVKTQFVIYPNAGHLIAQPEHRRDILKRLVAWFDEHLMPNEEERAAHPARSWRRLTAKKKQEEAQAAVTEFRKRRPQVSLESLKQVLVYKDPAEEERVLAALRKAGLK